MAKLDSNILRYQTGRHRSSIIVVQSSKMLPLSGWLSELCCDPDFHEPAVFSKKFRTNIYQSIAPRWDKHPSTSLQSERWTWRPFLPTEILTGYTRLFDKRSTTTNLSDCEYVINLDYEAGNRLFQVAKQLDTCENHQKCSSHEIAWQH